MKRPPVHRIVEPRECVALRTACGRLLSRAVRRTEDVRSVTCRNCQHVAPGKWTGLAGYSWRVRGFGEVDRDLTKAAARMLAPEVFVSHKVMPPRDKVQRGAKLTLEVQLKGADALAALAKVVKASGVVLEVVEAVEGRCMAVGGPVTPTLRAMRESELAQLWRAARVIATTKLPEIVEWRTAVDPRVNPLHGLPIEPVRGRERCVVVPIDPPDPRETRRQRVARVQRRRKARRKSR